MTNAHKWLGSARGLGALYAAPTRLGEPRAPVISHGFGRGFTSEFMWDGCRDYSAAVALPVLLKWWAWVGAPAARQYCTTLLAAGVALLAGAWGTRAHAPPDCYSHMACVQLPPGVLPPGAVRYALSAGPPPVFLCTAAHGKAVQDALYAARVEVPVKVLAGPDAPAPCSDGSCAGPAAAAAGADMRCYVRVSAYVYNSLDDFQRLADAVLALRWE